MKLETPPGLRRSGIAVAAAAIILVGVSLARFLPDWDAGRWWLLSVVGLAVAGLSGLVGLVRAVGLTGEARRRTHMGGAPVGVALAVGATLVLALVGVRGADDWHDLDVPAAWGRLGDDFEDRRAALAEETEVDPAGVDQGLENAFGGAVDDAQDATAGGLGELGPARIGECRDGDAGDPGTTVDCDGPHTVEVTGAVELDDDLDGADRVAAAVDACDSDPAVRDTPADAEGGAVTADDLQWEAGIRGAICLAVWPDPVEGLRTG